MSKPFYCFLGKTESAIMTTNFELVSLIFKAYKRKMVLVWVMQRADSTFL